MSTISGTSSRIEFEALLQPGAKCIGAVAELFLLDDVEHGMRRGDADRATAIGAAKAAGAGRVHDLGAAGDGRQREAAGKALGHGGQIGRHLMVVHGEHLAGAGKAGLHLVGDQQDAVLVADLAQRRHEIARRLVEAALALHRLEDDRGNAVRIDIGLEQLVERGERVRHRNAMQRDRERRVEDVARHGTEADLVRHNLPGQGHAHEGAAVEAARKGDDGLASSGVAGDLDGVLDRLGAGGDEDGFLVEFAGQHAVQPFGEMHIALIGHDLMAGVGETVELRLDRLDHLGVAMAGVDDRNARRKVDVAATLDVPDFRIFGAIGIDLRRHADTARNRLVLAFGNG